MLKKIYSKPLSLLLIFMISFCSLSFSAETKAATTITGNNSFSTAANLGYWKYATSVPTVILPADQNEAYFSFTVNAGEKIYARCSYDTSYTGMTASLYNSSQWETGFGSIVDRNSSLPFICVRCDGTSNNQTFYLKVRRGYYTGDMYFSLSFYDRIKTGYSTFTFPRTASNPGNIGLNSAGVDSTELKLDLRSNTTVPQRAIVTAVTTSSTQSPSQGNVHHKLLNEASNTWYTSTVSSATKGTYNISETTNLPVVQVWHFKYNALATAKSTMTNVKLNVSYKYDVTDLFDYS
ncbi:hypothetical protein [Clostridium cellulovorans]|uniref:Uncharacterized protein n=1 Tax=Clostridium cellulovorans (strain ATCC 35296 / DSM 3052 / OCM 3 / 743B) TaxID=573061 RepID=D9SVL3_CLOC7|nr:hypothetical protein [Clostridium cellulovorans]ADL51137.1 hypothetical protein Clocel_1384 [Clostridium cellulovorans 743B]